MADQDEIEFSELENYRAMTSDQRDALKARALHHAHAERSECLKSALLMLGSGMQKMGALLGRAWHMHWARRRWQAEIAELRGFDERALRDIGLTRLDVNALVHTRPGDTAVLER